MTFAIAFPSIDPVLIQFGPFAIRWYALMWIAGLLAGWWYVRRYARLYAPFLDARAIDDFLLWATLGTILGGRLGYVAFYNPAFYAAHPSEIFMVWRGGMSFHGGLIGMIAAIFWFARRRNLPFLAFGDAIACTAPIGLFLVRIANFINGELFGRPSDVPWAVVFPGGGAIARHPSQLYEAACEGLVLFALLFALSAMPRVRERPGLLTGVFMLGYAAARAALEQFRQPDVQIGFLWGGMTMGQLLSVPVALFGVALVAYALRRT